MIVALMGAGLKIDRPLSGRRWASTWRLLVIAMPLMHRGDGAARLVVGRSGAGRGAAARRRARPTDPVLAADVQVGEPTDEEDSEDEVRFALTSEAGLNDGLAFPFVYAAIAIATVAGWPVWLAEWALRTCSTRAPSASAAGCSIGKLLGKLFFRAPSGVLRLARHAEGFLALAATFLAYGLVEVVGGYGFLAVFVAARAIRSAERTRTSIHQCCTTSPSRSNGCSPCCCCCSSAAPWSAGCSRR